MTWRNRGYPDILCDYESTVWGGVAGEASRHGRTLGRKDLSSPLDINLPVDPRFEVLEVFKLVNSSILPNMCGTMCPHPVRIWHRTSLGPIL